MDKAKKPEEESVKDIELVDIEDIVPNNANSLFLCLARVLIYMSHKNYKFVSGLSTSCGLTINDLKSDILLQSIIRGKLCDYWCRTGVVYDKTKKKLYLTGDYANYFNGNVYDFLIQVYQLSINNFSNNPLFKKFALPSLSKMLNMKIFYKKSNGIWKCYEPSRSRTRSNVINDENNKDMEEEVQRSRSNLIDSTIYMQEFKSESNSSNKKQYEFPVSYQQLSSSNNSCAHNKSVRILLNKKLWLSNYADNSKICMKFSQFNDLDELRSFEENFFCMESAKIINLLNIKDNMNYYYKIFSVFLNSLPVRSLMYPDLSVTSSTSARSSTGKIPRRPETMNFIGKEQDLASDMNTHEDLIKLMEFTQEHNTIGKQFLKFEKLEKEQKIDNLVFKFLNYIWGKNMFDNDFIEKTYSKLSSYYFSIN